MPTFTITLANALEVTGGTAFYVDGRTVLENTNIGLEHYPIFSEEYRPILNSHIVDHYWNDEIAHETVAMFRQRLSAHMNLHMPMFNKRYELAMKEFDPLITMDIVTEGEQKATQTGTSESTSDGDSTGKAGSRNVFSDMPGTALGGNADYATNASDVTNFTESESASRDAATTASDTEGESKSTSRGYNGAPADILRRAQEALLNVDLMVIESLQPLFMSLWANGNEYPVKGSPYVC